MWLDKQKVACYLLREWKLTFFVHQWAIWAENIWMDCFPLAASRLLNSETFYSGQKIELLLSEFDIFNAEY